MPPLRTDKALGQHWLHDQRVIMRLVEALGPAAHGDVVEIGPGTGALTRALLAGGARVTAIELDPRCWPLLERLGEEHGNRLTLVRGDALDALDRGVVDLAGKAVAGNLPYNVGTEIVARLVTQAARPSPMVFMLQKEVVRRICARPGIKDERADWGRLAVLCDLFCAREDLFDVSPGSFSPPPKVMSSVVRLTPLPAPRYDVDLTKLDAVLRAIFGQRRKMLRGVLKGLVREETLARLGIDPTWRGEVLTTAQICALAEGEP